jgi:hypothetical protein
MSDSIQIGEDQEMNSSSAPFPTSSRVLESKPKLSLVSLLKKIGVAKTDAQANYLLIGISIVVFLGAAFIIGYYGFGIGRYQKGRISVPPEIFEKLPENMKQQIKEARTK